MIAAIHAEVRRLLSLRSTAVFTVLLIGCCFGPIIIMGIVYDAEYQGPIDASDIGRCLSIFHVLAIIFSGSYTATEIRSGSTAISFLTQKSRYASLAAQYIVEAGFLITMYVLGIPLALITALFYPDGLDVSSNDWPYFLLYPVIVLIWSFMTTSLAVITRSVAVAVAAPITWMLLIEQLMAQIPMLDNITPWLPSAASHSLLGQSLGEGSTAGPAWVAAIAVLAPAVTIAGAAVVLYGKRDVPA